MSLGQFLDDIYAKKCDIGHSFSAEVIADIESAVKELVWRIIHKAHKIKIQDIATQSGQTSVEHTGTFQDIFPVSRLIPVGSFYENTKVGDPYEFDFMLMIDIKNMIIEPGCGPGLVKIRNSQSGHWSDLESEGYLEVTNDDCVYPSVTGVFHNVFEKLTREESEYLSEAERIVERSSGSLKCLRSGMLHLAFLWSPTGGNSLEDHVISVDTMPAFECPEDFIEDSAKNGNFDNKFIDLVKKQRCYLIPKSCVTTGCTTCFHVTFATSENKLMKDMDGLHKKCYIILKHLVALKSEYEDNLTDVSSYKLKTCLLNHVHESPSGCAGSNIEDCTLDILQRLIVCYDKMKMPRFFQRNTSLFVKSEYSISVLDFLISTEEELALIIRQNEHERRDILDAVNVITWFELTRIILMITRGHLLYMRSQPCNKYEFSESYGPFESISHTLDFHFATSEEANVERNKWIDVLVGFRNTIYIPIFSLLAKSIPDSVLKQLEGSFCPPIPAPIYMYDKLRLDKWDRIKHEIENMAVDTTKKYLVLLVSGWFFIYDGQNYVTKNSLEEELGCVALLHRAFWEKMG